MPTAKNLGLQSLPGLWVSGCLRFFGAFGSSFGALEEAAQVGSGQAVWTFFCFVPTTEGVLLVTAGSGREAYRLADFAFRTNRLLRCRASLQAGDQGAG